MTIITFPAFSLQNRWLAKFYTLKTLVYFRLNWSRRMNGKNTYEEAVKALNGLQSNAAVIQKARVERDANAHLNLINTSLYLKYMGIELEDLNSLNILHIAGTKGKGSTCAFTESILRTHGYKTGFYSSPHLVSVNERIRINGSPISKDKFAQYFWKTYNTIIRNLKKDETMPPYFMFLTVLAFYVFMREKVQAAILEVGIGGLYDCTNIITKPVAVGITTLGIDHVNMLGHTLPKIAAQKAGIMKKHVPAFTVTQLESAMKVLREKSDEVDCPLLLSPPLESYEETVLLGAKSNVQRINASLALQLTNTWLKCMKNNFLSVNGHYRNGTQIASPLAMAPVFNIDSKTCDGLKNCEWLGRFQVLEKDHVTYFLDGAHTQESMKFCVKWFNEASRKLSKERGSQVLKVLLFNCTGERKAENLLDPLADVHFDLVLFCPNRVHVVKDVASDLSNFMVEPEKELQQCVTNREIWDHLMRGLFENKLHLTCTGSSHVVAEPPDNSLLFPSISKALNFVTSGSENTSTTHNSSKNGGFDHHELVKCATHVQVLVTGSLHLVGGVLSVISPTL